MKTLIIAVAAMLLPAAVLAQDVPAAAAATTAAPTTFPKCTAKIQDSCDQSATTEKNALNHYPADKRDAGNNKIGAPAARSAKHKAHTTKTTTTTTAEPAAQ